MKFHMQGNTPIRLLLLAILTSSTFAVSPCYYPDGSSEPADDVAPCKPAQEHSMCCYLKRTTSTNDRCNDNGVCSYGVDGRRGLDFVRGSCTDPTWKSPFCLSALCTQNTGRDFYQNGTAPVTICTDGSWCCGLNNYDCCNAGKGLRIAAILGSSSVEQSQTSTSTSSSPKATTSSTRTSQSSIPDPISATAASINTGSTATPPEGAKPAEKESSLSMAIGLGVGLPLAAIAISSAFFAYFMWRRNKTLTSNMQLTSDAKEYWDQGGGLQHRPPYEVETSERPSEIMTPEAQAAELPNHKHVHR